MKQTAIYQRKRPTASPGFNKWVQSPRWFTGFWIAVVGCLAVFGANLVLGRVHPSSVWGLSFGIAATALLGANLLYAVRRRTLRLRGLGKTWTYLQVHVYGGGLFLLLVLMHTGFATPRGVHTWWLYALSIWVVATGLIGIAIQKWIPTVLNASFPIEVHYDRVPALIDSIRVRSEKLVDGSGDRIRDFYGRNLAATLAGPRPQFMYFFDVTAGIHSRVKPFHYLRGLLAAEQREVLDELQQLYTSKLQIDAHYTLQKALRGWLILHVPASVVLVALLGFHIFSVLYY
ncbi:MAG: hypothetical protein ACI80V_002847 [Rhodothermales bacterium]|jgi:hypothetical protein